MNALNSVDIIVPIYNAYDDLTKCIASVYQMTDLSLHRLILIDDNSSDPRVLPYLTSIQGGNIIVIHNDINKGFSANVNMGMRNSDHDVILLNSDTIVTSNWIDKIYTCAYSDEQIATVTPLSNSATLASVPVFGVDNRLPAHVTIDRMSNIIERCSLREYPRIPVAVGFCMFIKRVVINSIGFFDEETFGRGYGEENDFCYRAELYGYKQVLCDDTFIYHKGTGSFLSEEKEKLIQEHIGILEDRYPEFMKATHLYCMENPHQFIRDNINIHLNFENDKRNLLYVLHADIDEAGENHIGGTQFYVRDLCIELGSQYNIFVMTPTANAIHLVAYINNKKYQCNFPIKDHGILQPFKSKTYKDIYELILNAFEIDIIHIHHIQGQSFDIFYSANSQNIPVILSIHDFYMICPTIFLYSIDGFLCINGHQGDCKKCLKQKLHITDTINYIDKWRKEVKEILPFVHKVIFPSNSAEKIFEQYYPDIKNKSLVIPHGITLKSPELVPPILNAELGSDNIQYYIEKVQISKPNENEISGWAFLKNCDNNLYHTFIEVIDSQGTVHIYKTSKTNRLDVDEYFHGNGKYLKSGFQSHIMKCDLPSGALSMKLIIQSDTQYFKTSEIVNTYSETIDFETSFNVAFIGGLSYVKGSDIAYDMIRNNSDINWFTFGNIDPQVPLAHLSKTNLFNIGEYQQDEIVNLLNKYHIDLICILSKCAETFCYTLSEALLARIPVIALDNGAVGERLKESQCGWTMPANSSSDTLMQKIHELMYSTEYESVKSKIAQLSVKTSSAMAKEYNEIYAAIKNQVTYKNYASNLIYKYLEK